MIFFIFNPCNTIQTYCYIKVSLYSRNHCVSFWIYGVRNTNSNFHLIWIVLIPNTIKTMYLINIQLNIIIIDCTKVVTWEIVTPRKMNINLGFASVDIGFLGVTISNVTLSCSQYLYYMYVTELLFYFQSMRINMQKN